MEHSWATVHGRQPRRKSSGAEKLHVIKRCTCMVARSRSVAFSWGATWLLRSLVESDTCTWPLSREGFTCDECAIQVASHSVETPRLFLLPTSSRACVSGTKGGREGFSVNFRAEVAKKDN